MCKIGLFHKFVAIILIVGLFPMLFIATFLSNNMMNHYEAALRSNYEQAVIYTGFSVERLLDSYDSIMKSMYQYNVSSEWHSTMVGAADNLRKVVEGELYEPEEMEKARKQEMEKVFLKNIQGVDYFINAAHFVGYDKDGNLVDFHYSAQSTYFQDKDRFLEEMHWNDIDKSTKKMQIIPLHMNSYYHNRNNMVLTLARNYFDIRGNIKNEKYVGTLFLDIDVQRIRELFSTLNFSGQESYNVVDQDGKSLFNSDAQGDVDELQKMSPLPELAQHSVIIKSTPNKYGIVVYVVFDKRKAFTQITNMQTMMYFVIVGAIIGLIAAAILFSKRLTKTIEEMMKQTSQIENGNFDIQIPVHTKDEISVLVERFNQMSVTLKKYINKCYVAQIKQNEAELTALRSQIYPHFLYNTLEIIRMNALENGDKVVSEMIEVLSKQIHYLIGPIQDMVPLEKEIDIIRGYVFLLNCRINGKVRLKICSENLSNVLVPRLILQPIVENAYVHGIKPKKGSGNIIVEVSKIDSGDLEISVMDNGAGIDLEAQEKIKQLLEGDTIGIRNEDNWQSIGMKNVHDRIRFLYGEEYGVSFTSSIGIGTIVRLRMPWIEERKECCNDENDSG